MSKPIVDNVLLIRLIEVELVNQYRRFLSKRLAKAPRNCFFNVWLRLDSGGYTRKCQVPPIKDAPPHYLKFINSQCNTLAQAKICPLYTHYTGGSSEDDIIKSLTNEFLDKLIDPEKRSSSFKPLHTLWLLLHEVETINISWLTRVQLLIMAKIFKKAYHKHLVKSTPEADKIWDQRMAEFKSLIIK